VPACSSSNSKNGSNSNSAPGAARDMVGLGLATAGGAMSPPGLLTAAADAAAGIPDYIGMGNLPASHWQRSAPLTMPPMPVLPVIPGRRPGGSEQQQGPSAGSAGGGGSAGAAAAPGSSGSGRPGSHHQQRRISMSSAAGAVMMTASRMSVSNVVNSSSNVASAEGSMHVPAGGEAAVAVGSKLAKQGVRSSVGGAASGSGSIPAAGL
jgi:hypothetical protein